MQKNAEIILFTYDYPFGRSEKTFLEYELSQLSKDFDKILEKYGDSDLFKNILFHSINDIYQVFDLILEK